MHNHCRSLKNGRLVILIHYFSMATIELFNNLHGKIYFYWKFEIVFPHEGNPDAFALTVIRNTQIYLLIRTNGRGRIFAIFFYSWSQFRYRNCKGINWSIINRSNRRNWSSIMLLKLLFNSIIHWLENHRFCRFTQQ